MKGFSQIVLLSTLCSFLVFSVNASFAQCDPTMPQEVPWVKIPVSQSKVETIPGSEIFPRMSFSFVYPGKIRTDFIVTNVKHNGGRVYLADWCYDQTIVDDPSVISERSTTKPFTVAAGDEISFFRELVWWNHFDDPLVYYALEDWEYQVVLEDAESGKQLATLDRITIAAQPEPGYPTITMKHPPAAVVHYTVPQQFDGRTVVLRFVSKASQPTYARFRRFDKMGIRFPEFRTQMDPSALLVAWKAGHWPPSAYEQKRHFVAYESGAFHIAPGVSSQPLELNVYSSQGKKVFSKIVRCGEHVPFVPPHSGMYQVELRENEQILSFTALQIAK